jgi:hypothetical protein
VLFSARSFARGSRSLDEVCAGLAGIERRAAAIAGAALS